MRDKFNSLYSFLLLSSLFILPNLKDFFSIPINISPYEMHIFTNEDLSLIENGNLFIQISILIFFILMIFNNYFKIYPIELFRDKVLLLYILFLISSIFYSVDSGLSIRRVTLFLIIISFGSLLVSTEEESLKR